MSTFVDVSCELMMGVFATSFEPYIFAFFLDPFRRSSSDALVLTLSSLAAD